MIKEIKQEPNADTVNILEDLLARARAGEVLSVAIAIGYSDRQTGNVFSFDGWPQLLIGEVRLMEHDLINCCDTRASMGDI